MKRAFLILAAALAWGWCTAQVPYSYAPAEVTAADITALGGNRNQFVQGLVLFDPADDPAWARLKGLQVKGVRCYLRADYKQARQSRSGILASVGSPQNIVNTTYADLTAGWNDVLFAEPITIGDDKLYLGVQAYETIGTPYPLVAYAPASVPRACFVNQAKKTWEEYSDRGTLLVAALLDDAAAPLLANTAYAQNAWHPQTVAPSAYFDGGLYIHNFGSEPITQVEVSMQGAGAAEPTLASIALPEPVAAYGSTVVDARLMAGAAEGTNVDWTASVTRVNGAAAQPGRAGTTTLFVTQDNFIRVPLVEEFTSLPCTNCPFMAYYLDKALEMYQKPYVYVAHHSGFKEDLFTTAPDRELTYVFGGYENEFNPAIMYNRAVFEGADGIIYGATDNKPDMYLAAVTFAAEQPAAAEVNVTHTEQTVTVTGRVARALVGTPLFISTYLVEDGISEAKYPQAGMDLEGAPPDLKQVFRHNGVILHYFNTNAIGDALTTDADGHFSLTYPMVTKEGYGGTARRFVAIVHKVNKSNLRENEALNATQEWLSGGPDGIREIRPASKAGGGLATSGNEVYDLSGRRLSDLPSARKGIYVTGGRKVVLR